VRLDVERLCCRSKCLPIRLVKASRLGRKGGDLVGIFGGLEAALCLALGDKRRCHLRHRVSLAIVTDWGRCDSQFKHVEFRRQGVRPAVRPGGWTPAGPRSERPSEVALVTERRTNPGTKIRSPSSRP
jgi:hypothetical protein